MAGLVGAELSADRFEYVNKTKNYDDRIRNSNVAGSLNRITSSIAAQLSQNKNFKEIQKTPLAIMSIVDMNDFHKTTTVGKRISENLIHEMHVRGYKVVDYKAMSQIEIDKNGDYIFSRAIKDLKNQKLITYALSGTFSTYRDGVSINCRIINIKTSVVLSTAQVFVPNRIIKNIEGKKSHPWYDRNKSNQASVGSVTSIKQR